MSLLRIADQARVGLTDIWSYIARDSITSADRLNARFYEAFKTLARYTMMGRSRPDLGPELRSFPVGRYAIFYRPIENGI